MSQNLTHLKEQVDKLVAEGKGDLPVFITDGHSGITEAWSGWCNLEEADENLDGEACDELEDGDEFIELTFG